MDSEINPPQAKRFTFAATILENTPKIGVKNPVETMKAPQRWQPEELLDRLGAAPERETFLFSLQCLQINSLPENQNKNMGKFLKGAEGWGKKKARTSHGTVFSLAHLNGETTSPCPIGEIPVELLDPLQAPRRRPPDSASSQSRAGLNHGPLGCCCCRRVETLLLLRPSYQLLVPSVPARQRLDPPPGTPPPPNCSAAQARLRGGSPSPIPGSLAAIGGGSSPPPDPD